MTLQQVKNIRNLREWAIESGEFVIESNGVRLNVSRRGPTAAQFYKLLGLLSEIDDVYRTLVEDD